MIQKEQLEKMLENSSREYIEALARGKEDMKMFYSGRINVLCKILEIDENEFFYSLIIQAKSRNNISYNVN